MPKRPTIMQMSDPQRGLWPALYRMQAWLSPGFPIGAYSFSHGLEAAVESGAVRDRNTLHDWINAILTRGSGRIDIDILCAAYGAAAADDVVALVDTNCRGVAFRATSETRIETTAQGNAFLAACRAAWADPFFDRWAARGETVCYPAAVAAAMARAGIPLDWALVGYLQAMAANLVSAGLRLGIIGQSDGQHILAALDPVVAEAAASGLSRGPDCFGSATFAVELASMAHETQYTRLFRS